METHKELNQNKKRPKTIAEYLEEEQEIDIDAFQISDPYQCKLRRSFSDIDNSFAKLEKDIQDHEQKLENTNKKSSLLHDETPLSHIDFLNYVPLIL